MADPNWGNCKTCRYFSSHTPKPEDGEVAKCMQPTLSEFNLSVSGASGCNAHEERQAAGSVYEAPQPAVH